MRQKKILTEQKKYKIELINKSNIYHINEIAMWRLCLLSVFNHFNLQLGSTAFLPLKHLER